MARYRFQVSCTEAGVKGLEKSATERAPGA
jgi:hypothetical protein